MSEEVKTRAESPNLLEPPPFKRARTRYPPRPFQQFLISQDTLVGGTPDSDIWGGVEHFLKFDLTEEEQEQVVATAKEDLDTLIRVGVSHLGRWESKEHTLEKILYSAQLLGYYKEDIEEHKCLALYERKFDLPPDLNLQIGPEEIAQTILYYWSYQGVEAAKEETQTENHQLIEQAVTELVQTRRREARIKLAINLYCIFQVIQQLSLDKSALQYYSEVQEEFLGLRSSDTVEREVNKYIIYSLKGYYKRRQPQQIGDHYISFKEWQDHHSSA